MDLLLRAGANTAQVDNFGFTALFEAVRKGHDECVTLLLEHKAE